jgi:hypothetical protein
VACAEHWPSVFLAPWRSPYSAGGEWWQEQPDGSWLKWNEKASTWEPQNLPPPPPAEDAPSPKLRQPPEAFSLGDELPEIVSAVKNIVLQDGSLFSPVGGRLRVLSQDANYAWVKNKGGEAGSVRKTSLGLSPGNEVEPPVDPAPHADVDPSPLPSGKSSPPETTTNGFAVAALVIGIVGFVIPLIGAILALTFGYVARGQINRSAGRMSGGGMAVAGIVLGWVQVAAFLAFVGNVSRQISP